MDVPHPAPGECFLSLLATQKLHQDAVRLATAYAECTVLRLILKPVLVPAKLYLTFTILRRRVNRER